MSRSPRPTSIEARLPLAIGALWLAGVVALSWVAYTYVVRGGLSAADERLQKVAEQLAADLSHSANRSVALVRGIAGREPLRAYLRRTAVPERPSPLAERPDSTAALAALADSGPQAERVAAMALWDNRGAPVLVRGPAAQQVTALDSRTLLARIAAHDSGAVGDFTRLGDSLVLASAAPVYDGMVRLGYVVEWRYIVTSAAERQSTLDLIGAESAVFIGSPGGTWSDLRGIVPEPPANFRDTSLQHYTRRGAGPRLAVTYPVPDAPWHLVLEFSERRVLAPAQAFLRKLALVGGIVSLIGTFGVWLLTRRMTRRLNRLTAAAQTISTSESPAGPGPAEGDELTRLGTAFTRMAARVDESHRELQQKIEELRATREQFAHTQRMEAVGRLAGGVAHDFNNLLTVILGSVELALRSPGSSHEEELRDVRTAGERAATLTRQLLTFSRRQLVTAVTLDVNEVVTDLEKMLSRLIGESIRLDTRLDSEPLNVRADRGQLEQVIVNLLVNARDAMPAGGTIIIETGRATLSDEYARTREDTVPGEYVFVAISDTGTGMTPEVQQHLFEPFFTTKEPGKGTGLGLATSYGIVKQGGGHIAVYTEPGVGTTMRVYLPAQDAAAEPRAPAAPAGAAGTELILLVEDEPGVRSVAARMLGARGYRVLQAANGKEAMRAIAEATSPIDLLLTDVVLPGIGGRELAAEARAAHPAIKVLFASGYTDDVVLQHQLLEHDAMFLQKPFTADLLASKVREALDAP